MEPPALNRVALARFQNMVHLARELRLPVIYQARPGGQPGAEHAAQAPPPAGPIALSTATDASAVESAAARARRLTSYQAHHSAEGSCWCPASLQQALPVTRRVQVHMQQEGNAEGVQRYLIVVRTCADHVFPKYFKHATRSDLVLFRGMFLSVTFDGDVHGDAPQLLAFGIQQAFLPKFENDGQDTRA